MCVSRNVTSGIIESEHGPSEGRQCTRGCVDGDAQTCLKLLGAHAKRVFALRNWTGGNAVNTAHAGKSKGVEAVVVALCRHLMSEEVLARERMRSAVVRDGW